MGTISFDTISLKIQHNLNLALDKIASKEDKSKSSLVRKIISEYIEDRIDIKATDQAFAEFEKNQKTYSLDQIKEENDL